MVALMWCERQIPTRLADCKTEMQEHLHRMQYGLDPYPAANARLESRAPSSIAWEVDALLAIFHATIDATVKS